MQINFDASQVAPAVAGEIIPAGWYPVQIVKSEGKPTSKGDGMYLETEMEIIGGEHKGRKLFDRFNLQNSNPIAVEIAYRMLSAVCHAVGVIQVADSQQLHGRPLMAKVKLIPAGPGADGKMYEAKNEVSGYKAFDASAMQPSAPVGNAPAWATGGAPAAPAFNQQAPAYTAPAPAFNPAPAAAAPTFAPAAPAAGATPPWATGGQPVQQAQAPAPVAPAPAPAAPAAAPWANAQPNMAGAMPAPAAAPTAPAANPPWAGVNPAAAAPAAGGAVPPWAVNR